MPERTAALHVLRTDNGAPHARRRCLVQRLAEAPRNTLTDAGPSSWPQTGSTKRWCFLPQDLTLDICRLLGAEDLLVFALCGRWSRELSITEDVWKFFCRRRWGLSANLHVYKSAKVLYYDSNGWFPRRTYGGWRPKPRFLIKEIHLQPRASLTMDVRTTDNEVFAVSEAVTGARGGNGCVDVVDTHSGQVRQTLEVSAATINCCDIGRNGDVICVGSDDAKVRLFRRGHHCHQTPAFGLAGEYPCMSEVNDLRYTREDHALAVRTHQNRHPAGLDIIPLERPEARYSVVGGSLAAHRKFIHAIDGFEEGCTLNEIACSGEHPRTSAFSAMLFDFRTAGRCVLDVPVTSGYAMGTMLWPLRAGRCKKVYANLLQEETHRRTRGTIVMVDFRYPTAEIGRFDFQEPVDDFRCFSGDIYSVCPEPCVRASSTQRLRILRTRTSEGSGLPECLHTVVRKYDATRDFAREDLKVLSVNQRGFALSYGENLCLGTITEPDRSSALPTADCFLPQPFHG
eukprot:TRINITY_DN101147_c0_g1_i1.p1 TRINITY_DN101147_c0_g1~~TRINITY_DN101147_c0_g1_i1.p1  ORF type:complete len:513 (-),score=29.04 TRINITY_DN101147_c0_g1_i1:88-1626(-)